MRRLILGGLALAVLAWLAWRWVVREIERQPEPVVVADTLVGGVRAVRLYFAARDGEGLVAESRELADPAGLHALVVALVAELDRGPRGDGVAVLPPGTAVLRVYADDRGLLTLDLSRALRDGFAGGAGAEYLAVASLVRTLAANLPEVRRVLLVSGGVPLPTLGGHLPLDEPLDVADWP